MHARTARARTVTLCAQRVSPRLLRSSALLRIVGTLPARYGMQSGDVRASFLCVVGWLGLRVVWESSFVCTSAVADIPWGRAGFPELPAHGGERGGAALGAHWFLRGFPRVSLRRSHRLCFHSFFFPYSVLCLVRQRIQFRCQSTEAFVRESCCQVARPYSNGSLNTKRRNCGDGFIHGEIKVVAPLECKCSVRTFKTFKLPDEKIIIDRAERFRCAEAHLHCPCSFMNQMLVELVRTDVFLSVSTSLLMPNASVPDELV